jgi:hypothetical protein
VASLLSRDKLLDLARLGATVRLAELKRERQTLNAILNGGAAPTPHGTRAKTVRRRRRPTWTAAQRKAVSVRMQKYWAKRRATPKKVHPKRATPA